MAQRGLKQYGKAPNLTLNLGEAGLMTYTQHPPKTTQDASTAALNNGSQSTRHTRQVSHNNSHDLYQIYSARNG